MLQRPRTGFVRVGWEVGFLPGCSLIQLLNGTAEPAQETIPRPHHGVRGTSGCTKRSWDPAAGVAASGQRGCQGCLQGLCWKDVSSCFPGLLYKYPPSPTWFSTALRNSCAAYLNTHVRHLRPSSPCFPSPFILGATYPPCVTDQK